MEEKTGVTNTLVSVGAMLALAVVPGAISFYMFAVMGQSGARSVSMVLLAGALGLVAFYFAGSAAYTLFLGATGKHRHPQPQENDDSWKNMPYPKD